MPTQSVARRQVRANQSSRKGVATWLLLLLFVCVCVCVNFALAFQRPFRDEQNVVVGCCFGKRRVITVDRCAFFPAAGRIRCADSSLFDFLIADRSETQLRTPYVCRFVFSFLFFSFCLIKVASPFFFSNFAVRFGSGLVCPTGRPVARNEAPNQRGIRLPSRMRKVRMGARFRFAFLFFFVVATSGSQLGRRAHLFKGSLSS